MPWVQQQVMALQVQMMMMIWRKWPLQVQVRQQQHRVVAFECDRW
jgi:hypothetical protein